MAVAWGALWPLLQLLQLLATRRQRRLAAADTVEKGSVEDAETSAAAPARQNALQRKPCADCGIWVSPEEPSYWLKHQAFLVAPTLRRDEDAAARRDAALAASVMLPRGDLAHEGGAHAAAAAAVGGRHPSDAAAHRDDKGVDVVNCKENL